MASYPPPPPGPPYGDWKYQRRLMRDQAKAQRDQMRYQMRMGRRRSLLGPLFSILVGVVFLLSQTGHLQLGRFWDWYGRWWPLLLVAAGVILVAEWAIDRARAEAAGQAFVRRSVGGGVLVLLIFVALAGLSVSIVRRHHDFFNHTLGFSSDDLQQFLGEKHESDQSLSQAIPANAVLTLENPRGDVTITGTSSDGQIHLSLHKEVYSRTDSDAEAKANRLAPEIHADGTILSVVLPAVEGSSADVTMTIPPVQSLTVNANHGDISVTNVNAPVTVTGNHGDIEVTAIGGPVVAHVNSGSSSVSAHNVQGTVTVEGRGQDLTLSDIRGGASLTGDFFGTTHLEHISGPIRFHTIRTDFQLARLDGELEISSGASLSASQAVGPVVLTTRNRNITLDQISGDLSVTNRNGSVDLSSAPPMGNVTVENRNGSVSLTSPEKAGFVVRAETTDGDIDNDFSLPVQSKDSRRNLTGTVGKGGPLVRIHTTQGDVSLKSAAISPLPPAPPMPPAPPAAMSIHNTDGSSVYVGKDGVRILSGSDGSRIILGKDGLNITENASGSSTYTAPDGTNLVVGTDGSRAFTARDGTQYTRSAASEVTYAGSDGTRITIEPDGTQTAIGPGGGSLSPTQVRDRLRQVEDRIREVERERDAARRSAGQHK